LLAIYLPIAIEISKNHAKLDLTPKIALGFQPRANKYFTPENRDRLRCGDLLLLLNTPQIFNSQKAGRAAPRLASLTFIIA